MTGVLVKRGGGTQRHIQKEDGHVTTAAVIGVMPLHTKEHQGLLETQEARREVWTGFSPGAFRESVADVLILHFQPLDLWWKTSVILRWRLKVLS